MEQNQVFPKQPIQFAEQTTKNNVHESNYHDSSFRIQASWQKRQHQTMIEQLRVVQQITRIQKDQNVFPKAKRSLTKQELRIGRVTYVSYTITNVLHSGKDKPFRLGGSKKF